MTPADQAIITMLSWILIMGTLLATPLASAQTISPNDQAARDQTRKAILANELREEVEQLQSAIASNTEQEAAHHRANIAALTVEMKINPPAASNKTRTAPVARWCDAFCKARRSTIEVPMP